MTEHERDAAVTLSLLLALAHVCSHTMDAGAAASVRERVVKALYVHGIYYNTIATVGVSILMILAKASAFSVDIAKHNGVLAVTRVIIAHIDDREIVKVGCVLLAVMSQQAANIEKLYKERAIEAVNLLSLNPDLPPDVELAVCALVGALATHHAKASELAKEPELIRRVIRCAALPGTAQVAFQTLKHLSVPPETRRVLVQARVWLEIKAAALEQHNPDAREALRNVSQAAPNALSQAEKAQLQNA
jgi:hypothetical protein